jgi:hypothetical protein
MSELYWNTVTANMRLVLGQFAQKEIAQRFYLAGGTALALQLGHRRSVDLDFFSPSEDIPTIRPQLEAALAPLGGILADSAWGNLVYLAQNVRVGFYGYGFPLIAPTLQAEGMMLASSADIALMKLDALLSRAARKDFYDLYFICQNISLRQLFQKAPQKYASIRDFEIQTVKRLVFFESAEQDSDPLLLRPVAWQTVKDYFIGQAKEIERSWLE